MKAQALSEIHLQRMAYVYVRQSTMGQLRMHKESTDRQYQFQERALELGWGVQMVAVLDRDLGRSGTEMTQREDFKQLVTAVSMGQAGAVFALEASRLSRSSADWHRLLELCACSATLIVDEDGIYDPTDFNDQLLLGLKGTMSQVELHMMHARLWGGKLNKAKRGELHFPLPVGYCRDVSGQTVIDPDTQVHHAVALVFRLFNELGSGCAVVKHFAREGLKFPKRAYGGPNSGDLLWGPLQHSRVVQMLKNPAYAGCYVFGRHHGQKTLSSEGEIQYKTQCMPVDQWPVRIPDHHDGYINWEQYLANQDRLARNRSNGPETLLPGPAREGHGLLQGLLICGKCGHRVSVRYRCNGRIQPYYECNGLRRDGQATCGCISFRGERVDHEICTQALARVEPARLQIALAALDQLDARMQAAQQQWQLREQRLRYDIDLAERRYREVDPANRLVAASLERGWNDALSALAAFHSEYQAWQQQRALQLDKNSRARLLALADDLPRVWGNSATSNKTRKEILRLLIADITVERQQRCVYCHVRWHDESTETIAIELAAPIAERLRYSCAIITLVRKLAVESDDHDIAAALNASEHQTAKGGDFTPSIIKWIRYKHQIPGASGRRPGEHSVSETASRYTVSHGIVYYWIQAEIVPCRHSHNGSRCWLQIDSETDAELHRRAAAVAVRGKVAKANRLNSSAT